MNDAATKAVRDAMQDVAQRHAHSAVRFVVPFDDAEQVVLHLERNGYQVLEAAPNDAWIVFFEDPDRDTELRRTRPDVGAVQTFVGADAEGAARRFYEQASQSWNCTLFRAVSPPIDRHTVR